MTCGRPWSLPTRGTSVIPVGEHLAHQASCLNLVTNAVIVWNTVYMAAVVEQLKQEGYPVQESDLAHIWPTRYAHINVYGKYHFNLDEVRSVRAYVRSGSRAARKASAKNFSTPLNFSRGLQGRTESAAGPSPYPLISSFTFY